MNKAQLVEAVSSLTKLNKVQAENALDAFVVIVRNRVKQGDEVKVKGFGTFYRRKTKERPGRNPQTGETFKIPACGHARFRVSAEFKALVK